MDKELIIQYISSFDFLCWKFDTTGKTKYQREFKKIMKELAINDQNITPNN